MEFQLPIKTKMLKSEEFSCFKLPDVVLNGKMLIIDGILTFMSMIIIPPANFVGGGYTVFFCPCVRPSVTFCFLNILKSHRWNFIKLCKHVHIYKTNTLSKKVRARGQFY